MRWLSPVSGSWAPLLSLVIAGCGADGGGKDLYEDWRNTCPEQAAAIDADPVDTETWNRWRRGDLEALDCWITLKRADRAARDNRHWALGPAPETEPWIDAFRQSQFFELLYYRWRATGEGLDELEAMARTMEHRSVERALWHYQFRDSARFAISYNEDMTISRDDPGYRFLELAKPNTPETEPPE